jgi:hypothetical protein
VVTGTAAELQRAGVRRRLLDPDLGPSGPHLGQGGLAGERAAAMLPGGCYTPLFAGPNRSRLGAFVQWAILLGPNNKYILFFFLFSYLLSLHIFQS